MKNSREELRDLLDAHLEWLLIDASGRAFSLRGAEIEIEEKNGRTLFGFLDDKGFQTWRICGFQTKKAEIILNLSRNFEREHAKLRLVPRILARELSDSVELARIEKAERIAQIVERNVPRSKLVRVELGKENGRFAQIIFEDNFKKQTAVLADVTDGLTPEFLLSAAILWQAKLAARKKNRIENVWLAAEKKQAQKLRKLHALLRDVWKSRVLIKEFSKEEILKDLSALEISDLWSAKPKPIKSAAGFQTSEAARRIIEIAPEEIDAIFARSGETLRFSGLPFARVRKIADAEKVWFGAGKAQMLLSENTFDEFTKTIETLREFRRFDSPNKRHVFYQSAPEAWLEAILRKNIKLLDANLILSPVYHQFRAERGKIDLLALRKDGRLVIIELKVAADREVIYQAADYWRKIENLRRAGNLQNANLFGDLTISDAPTICYLVAPTLAFHRDFEFLAQTLAPEIEFHRFNLAENWREKTRVLERI